MKIAIINGPNLNLLGRREPGIYGDSSFETYFEQLRKKFPQTELHYVQSNIEGELIDAIHRFGFDFDGILLNAGAYTHTSVALADAVAAIQTPVIEVHISNIFSREDYRHVSYLGAKCRGSISGLGLTGYALGVHYLIGGTA